MVETIKKQKVHGKIIGILSNICQKSEAYIKLDKKGPPPPTILKRLETR